MSGKSFSEFMSANGEWLRWLLAIVAVGLLYASDTRYVRKEELADALRDIATSAEGANTRLLAIEKTLAVTALQTATLADHEERIRALERKR